MTSAVEIPIFPLGTVLFPAGRLSLRIFETRYYDMTKACIRDDRVFGVSLIRGGFEVGTPAIPSERGCTARITEWEVPAPGLFNLTARGESVFHILERRVQPDGLIVATIEYDEPPDPTPLPDRYAALAELLVGLIGQIGEEYFPSPQRLDDAAWVGNRLTELLPVPPERKQSLLELNDPLSVLAEVEQLVKNLREPP
jgi:Lon protease-like protein